MELLKIDSGKAFTVFSVAVLLLAGCFGLISDSSDAAVSETWDATSPGDRTISVNLGDSVTLTFNSGASGSYSYYYTPSGYPSWLTLTANPNRILSGTASEAGTFSFSVTHYKVNDRTDATTTTSFTVTINVIAPSYTHSIFYDSNGGSGAPASQSVTDSNTSLNMTVSSDVPTRSGYTFLGWSTDSTATTATYTGGDTISVGNGTLVLYAVWKVDVNVSDMTVLTGDSVFITPVVAGDVTVSGADWLIANGNIVYGEAPSTAGTYSVTITCGLSTGTFTITVVSALAPTNTPSNGAIVFVKG